MLDLEKYICKIANENDKVIGTGFFVLPDGYIVTCNHVVKGLKGNVKVGISSESEPIKGEIVRDYEKEDISVIKINREKCPFLLLSTESESGGYIFSHGFSIDNSLKDFPKGFPMKSILTLPTTLENGLKIFVLEDTKVNSGLSGAPAVNDKGNVIGIFGMEYKGRALVIPIEYLFGKWSDLETKHRKLLQEKYQMKPEINIPTIEETLKKGRKLEGDFFKEEPRWIDFEGGFIVERNEVNEIIKKMKNEKTQLILGAPASGKSIILKNVGYKLARDNKSVYILELKQHSKDEIKLFFENIPRIINENSIIIVDDAHLNFDDCEKLIEDFENEGKGNLIIGSRETEEIRKGYLKDGSEFRDLIEEEKCIRIKAEDVTEEMIRTFLEKKHKEYDFSAERIKIVSDNLEKYKKDLWHLSWALKAYNPEKYSVSKDEICEKIRDSIRNIEVSKGQDEKQIILNAEDIFLPLSIFYRFEIPIERNYLVEQLGIEENIIKQLIGLQEIREKEEAHKILSLHHSSIAELFFRAYLRYKDLGRITRTKLLNQKDEEDLFFPFYHYIISSDPRNAIDVFIYLHRDFSNEKGGLSLLKELIKKDEIQKSIENGINKEDDMEKIGECVRDIEEVGKEIGLKLVNSLDPDVLSLKIEKEPDLIKVGKCLKYIIGINENVGDRLVKGVSERIAKEDDLAKVGRFVSEILQINKYLALKLADSISSRIKKEGDIEKIGKLISVIAIENKELALKLADSIDADDFSAKITEVKDIEKIGKCVGSIAGVNNDVGLKLIESITPKIDEEKDIEKIGNCITQV